MTAMPAAPISARSDPGTAMPAPPARPLGLSAVLAPLRRNLRTILVITLAVLAAVLIGWTVWPAKYKAVALVALDPQTPGLIADRDTTATSGAGGEAAVISLAELATSDSFLIPLAKTLNLLDDPEFADGADDGAVAVGVAAGIKRNLKVTRRGLSYLIDVSFTSKSAEKAARIANAIAAEIVQRQQSQRRDAIGGVSDALRSRLADLRSAVLASEKAVADYRQQNNLLDVAPDGRVGLKRLNSLAEQLGPIRARLEDARARYDKLRKTKGGEDVDPSLYRSERLTDLMSRITEEKRQAASAASTYGPRHPTVDAARARITSLEEAIRAERSRILEQTKAEVDVLTEQSAAYEAEIAKRTREQLAIDQKEVVLQDLVRQAQADRQIYEQFLARQKTTQEQGELAQPEAVVMSTASPPNRSNRPGLSLAAAVGLLGGLGAGILWAIFGAQTAAPAAPRRPLPAAPDDTPPSATATETPPAPPPTPAPLAATVVAPAVEPLDAPVAAPLVEPTLSVAPPPLVRAATAMIDPGPPIVPPEPIAPVVEPVIVAPVVAAPVVVEPPPALLSVPAPVVEATVPPAPIVSPEPPAAVAATVVPPDEAVAEPAAPVGEAETPPVRVSARRNDPAQRLRRMLRTLEDHDVPLVADLTPLDVDAHDGLAAFVETLATHLAASPGLTLTVVGVADETAPVEFLDALAGAVEAEGFTVALADDPDDEDQSPDLVIATVWETDPVPTAGSHPFVLVVAEPTGVAEERLGPAVTLWESDPDRVVVAAFDRVRAG